MTEPPATPDHADEPGGKAGPAPGDRAVRRPAGPGRNPKARQTSRARALIETPGPDPNAALADIRLAVGRIAGTHGVHGELKLKLLTDHPEHLELIDEIYLGESDQPTRLLGVRITQNQALIRIEGIDTPEAGKALGGLVVRIAGTDARPLEDDEYFLFQLIGLDVFDLGGEQVGRVADLMETGAHDVLVIDRGDGVADLLVPNHPEFVKEIDPAARKIVIDPPRYDG